MSMPDIPTPANMRECMMMAAMMFGIEPEEVKHFVIVVASERKQDTPIRMLTSECNSHTLEMLHNGMRAVIEGETVDRENTEDTTWPGDV